MAIRCERRDKSLRNRFEIVGDVNGRSARPMSEQPVNFADGIQTTGEFLQEPLNVLSAQCNIGLIDALGLQSQQRREHGEMIGDAVVRFIDQLACERDRRRLRRIRGVPASSSPSTSK